MFRVSTSEFTYELPEDIEYSEVWVSFKQRDLILTKKLVVGSSADSGIIMDGNTVLVSLDEEETSDFAPGFAWTQVKVKTVGDQVLPSDEFRIIVKAVEDNTPMSGGE